MERTLTIQAAAEESGLSAHTLRYYEQIGLIEPVPRTSSGHRAYSERHLRHLMVVKRMRETGMNISQLQEFMAAYQRGDEGLEECGALLEQHQQRVQAQLDVLKQAQILVECKLALFRERAAQMVSTEHV